MVREIGLEAAGAAAATAAVAETRAGRRIYLSAARSSHLAIKLGEHLANLVSTWLSKLAIRTVKGTHRESSSSKARQRITYISFILQPCSQSSLVSQAIVHEALQATRLSFPRFSNKCRFLHP